MDGAEVSEPLVQVHGVLAGEDAGEASIDRPHPRPTEEVSEHRHPGLVVLHKKALECLLVPRAEAAEKREGFAVASVVVKRVGHGVDADCAMEPRATFGGHVLGQIPLPGTGRRQSTKRIRKLVEESGHPGILEVRRKPGRPALEACFQGVEAGNLWEFHAREIGREHV